MINHRIKHKKQNIFILKLKIIAVVFIIAVIFISILSVLGRYITKSFNNFIMESKEFYFYSDKLKEDGEIYQINNWSGVEDYNITINMNSLKNNLKSASYDIGYDITYNCSNNIICQLSKTSGIIDAKSNSDTFSLRITPNAVMNNGDIAWIEIIAKSNGEYTKELRAEFKLVVGKENITYEIEDKVNRAYLELNITNTQSYYIVKEPFESYQKGQRIDVNVYLNLSEENKAKCYSGEITLKFDPKKVRIDMTDKNYINAINQKTTRINRILLCE